MKLMRCSLRALIASSSFIWITACGDLTDEKDGKSASGAAPQKASSEALQACPKLKLTGAPGPVGPGGPVPVGGVAVGAGVGVAGGAWWGPWGGFGGAWGKGGYGYGIPGKWGPGKFPPGKPLPPPPLPPPVNPVPPPPPPPPGPGGVEPFVPVAKGGDGVTQLPPAQPNNPCLAEEFGGEPGESPVQK